MRCARTALSSLALILLTATAMAEQPPIIDDDLAAFLERVKDARPEPSEAPAAGDAFINAGRGPIPVRIPATYDAATPTPLIILLPGYMTSGQEVEDWMQLSSLVDEYEFLYVYPTGTSDFLGFEFWNATDACCNLFGSGVDDVGYLLSVIETMQQTYNIDPRRIHFAGHSNGGFMSYRMACERADLVASVASLAGATFQNAGACTPSEPVHTLQIHGTSDAVIQFGGGCIPLGGCYPSAQQTVETWAAYNGCASSGVLQPEMLDLDASIAGSESTVTTYTSGCDDGGSTEFWTIPGGAHSPPLSADFSRLMVEFLLSHPKPNPCPADISADGAVTFTDLTLLLSAWGPCGGCAEDVDGDGAVSFSDLVALLGAWGPCD